MEQYEQEEQVEQEKYEVRDDLYVFVSSESDLLDLDIVLPVCGRFGLGEEDWKEERGTK